jgi:hypothetical protein
MSEQMSGALRRWRGESKITPPIPWDDHVSGEKGANRPGLPDSLRQNADIESPSWDSPLRNAAYSSHLPFQALSSPSTHSVRAPPITTVSRRPQADGSVVPPAQRLVKGKCHLTLSFFLRHSLCLLLVYIVGRASDDWSQTCCSNNTNLCLCPDNSV